MGCQNQWRSLQVGYSIFIYFHLASSSALYKNEGNLMNIETHSFTHSWVEMQSGRLWQGCLPLKLRKRIAKRIAKPMRNGQAGRHRFPRWAWMEPLDTAVWCSLTEWLPVKEVLYHSETFGRVLPAVTWLCSVVFQGSRFSSIPADRWILIPIFLASTASTASTWGHCWAWIFLHRWRGGHLSTLLLQIACRYIV